ncbi:MAG: hypothetical protein JO063_09940 [Pseudonocardiales bacterium]|nr:hypothetical protein [Pseudonocardiales bacterium]MBV9030283.1 hypothetical protein [Pseudonocardiales bacterium]MBW0010418.1 hypothetical protein [Pseudonocardiales bacterium]
MRGRYDWLWRGGPSFLAPDGSQVLLRGTALDVSRPWSCGFVALVRGARRSFTVAEAGAFDWHSTYTTIPDQLLRQPYRGGELIIGVIDDPAEYRAAWRGQWFELHTRAAGSAEGVTRVFDAFRLTDTPLGMMARPRSTGQAQLEPIRVAKQVPGIGYLTIERPGTGQLAVPEHRGHPTQHGELWREPLGPGAQGRSRSDALVLATPTAITRLVPGPADTADPDEALAFLHGLSVTWELT